MFRRRVTALAVVGALGALAACSSGSAPVAVDTTSSSAPPSASATATASPTPSRTPTPPPVVQSLSGKPGSAGKPVVAVKIDNAPEARPQTGLNAADVVYVEQVESGMSRFMAVFQSSLPDKVGPVRSGRESDVHILAPFGKVGFAYSGAQSRVNAIIHSSPQVTREENASGYWMRDRSRYAPHNLYLDLPKFLEVESHVATADDIGLRFAQPVTGGGKRTSLTAQVTRDITMSFAYDAAAGVWLVSQNGSRAMLTSGDQVSTHNVLVQEVLVTPSRFKDKFGGVTPYTETRGTGKFWLLRADGSFIQGTWQREGDGPTTYTGSGGREAQLSPGRTWILLKDDDYAVEVS